MQPFLHDRVRRLHDALRLFTEALTSYNNLDLDLRARVEAVLDGAAALYRDAGLAAVENEMTSLKAQFTSAVHGVHPLTLEPVTAKRRTTERAIAMHVLVLASDTLRRDEHTARQQLDEGAQQLRAIALNAIAQGLVRTDQIPLATEAEVDGLWLQISTHPNLALAAKQVSMMLHPMDVRILFVDLVGPG